MSNTPEFEIFAPILITANNYSAFENTVAQKNNGSVNPADISRFMANFKADAMQPVATERPYAFQDPQNPNVITRVVMYAAPPSKGQDISRLAALLIDMTLKDGKQDQTHPREWIIGPGVQAIFPYKMSCCSGLSAFGAIKQDGKTTPILLENIRMTTEKYRDLFNIENPNKPIRIKFDPDGKSLIHWLSHMIDPTHAQTCQSAPMPQSKSALAPRQS
ncbi:MAG: hypothetical protein J0L77_07265 [Alphaproteobacteria bacterium]|nr:hypothetical protein [Alphaproteobacteria bacterium]